MSFNNLTRLHSSSLKGVIPTYDISWLIWKPYKNNEKPSDVKMKLTSKLANWAHYNIVNSKKQQPIFQIHFKGQLNLVSENHFHTTPKTNLSKLTNILTIYFVFCIQTITNNSTPVNFIVKIIGKIVMG